MPTDHTSARARVLCLLAVAACVGQLAGCGSKALPAPAPVIMQAPALPMPPKPIPTSVEASIVAAAALNPSVSNRPSPLVLRIYELRSDAAFQQAEFMALYQTDRSVLATDLVNRDEITLQPGDILPYSRPLGPDTRYIGVVAAYRNLERARWRVVVPVQPNRANHLTIHADALALTAVLRP
jgi:type VI secretion system protein VasD